MARRPMWRAMRHGRQRAQLCSATSEAGQAQESSKPVVDARPLFEELADACAELRRAPRSMVRMRMQSIVNAHAQ